MDFVRIPRPDFGQQEEWFFVLPEEPAAAHPLARPASEQQFFKGVVLDGADDCSQAAWEAYVRLAVF